MTAIHRHGEARPLQVAPGVARTVRTAALTLVLAVPYTAAVSVMSDGAALALSVALLAVLSAIMFLANVAEDGPFARALSTGPIAGAVALLYVYASAITLALAFLLTI